MRPWQVVFVKEIVDSVRDRRTIAMIVVASILAGPLILWLMSTFVKTLTDKVEARKVYVAQQEWGPTAVNFFQRQSAEIVPAPSDYYEQVKAGKLDAVIVFEADFESRLRTGGEVHIELVYDDSRTAAAPSISLARGLITGFGREQASLRLLARGVSPELMNPVKIDATNLSTPKQRAAGFLLIIPMTTLILCLTGGMAVGIDTTAGERERGSLEPLLFNPVGYLELVFGKWLAVTAYSSVVVLLAIMGYVLALLYMPIKIDLPLNFGWREFGLFGLIAIPLAAMMGAALMLIATFGRSFKEAQTYASYLSMVVSFVPAIALLGSLKDAFWQLLVPVLGANMVFMRILRGEALELEHFLVPLALAVVLVGICLVTISRLLKREAIVFGRG